MTTYIKVASELILMNKDSLAALVVIGAKAGDPLQFITDATDRFIVANMMDPENYFRMAQH